MHVLSISAFPMDKTAYTYVTDGWYWAQDYIHTVPIGEVAKCGIMVSTNKKNIAISVACLAGALSSVQSAYNLLADVVYNEFEDHDISAPYQPSKLPTYADADDFIPILVQSGDVFLQYSVSKGWLAVPATSYAGAGGSLFSWNISYDTDREDVQLQGSVLVHMLVSLLDIVCDINSPGKRFIHALRESKHVSTN